MADVRSLLRNERASRRINHPHASYTESGKLLCNVCALQIKTESQWESHVRSPAHSMRLQQARDTAPTSKKRKAGDEDDDNRKRVKGVPEDFFEQPIPDQDVPTQPGDEESAAAPPDQIDSTSQTTIQPASVPAVDENEWAAFERDMAALEQPAPVVVSAAATISAAPMTAEEIAAQAREEQSVQRGRREAEIEAEKEDAEQALQDEFDEMEELEDRVRRLREKREALRKAREAEDETLPDAVSKPATLTSNEEDEDEEDDEDDFDDWKFGAN